MPVVSGLPVTPSKIIAEVPNFHPYGWVADPCVTRELRDVKITDSDFENLSDFGAVVKRFRSVLLPNEIDLNRCSDAIELILFGEMHHSGPTAFFARIADHFEFGPIALRTHSAHVDFRDFPFERVKRQASRLNVLPPLIGTEYAVSWLDSKVLCSSRGPLNLLNEPLVFLELVNDVH